MKKFYFDLETVPIDDTKKEMFLEIQKAKHKKKNTGIDLTEEELKKMFESTCFDGTFGRICCLGYIKEENKKIIDKGSLSGNEKDTVHKFWELVKDVDQFIGHNIFDFDLPFMFKRSIVLGIKPSREINLARFRSFPIYDTMWEWEKWGRDCKASLDTLAKVLELPTSKDEMDGSMVWPYFQEGKFDEICRYCMKDVELVRKVYYKMNFEELPKEEPTQVTLDEIPF
ncbi:MAG TPA: ribonuclease H-like domain-containing protein [Candidatus Nitrosocosmicus sp.]|nr:ribonuclease H-like domain-containing protein [Candidatus Nitrosocosmicus sp.]